jgi:hypothetical protein
MKNDEKKKVLKINLKKIKKLLDISLYKKYFKNNCYRNNKHHRTE